MSRSGDSTERSGERHLRSLAALAALALVATVPGAVAQEAAPKDQAQDPSPVVLLEADVLIDDQQAQTITAEGDVEVNYGGRLLRADRVVYDVATGRVRAKGGVQIRDTDGSETFADEVELDDRLERGVATEFRARIAGGASLASRGAIRRGPVDTELTQVIYTSCPLCIDGRDVAPTWTLRARRARQDGASKMIVYRDAVLQVAGVPVLYLPYFTHPDPTSGPRSGFLPPDFGRNRRLGTFYEQPYHWQISPSQDVTLRPQVNSRVRALLGLDYRKRFWSGDVEANVSGTYEQDFDSRGETFGPDSARGHIFARGNFEITPFWDWGFGIERASDDLYLRRYRIDGTGERRGPFVGDQFRLVSQLFAIGQNADSYASVNFISFQGLRAGDDTPNLPLILPYAEYERVLNDPLLSGQLKLSASTAVLNRSQNANNARASAGAAWRADVVLPAGLVFSPFAEARGDLYRIGGFATTSEQTLTRAVGLGGAELSLPLIRPGPRVDLLVEPVAMVALGSNGGNDPRIPNEDSLTFELDDSNLLRPNAAPNYDLWEPGSRASLGFRGTARNRTGQTASVFFGRRWRGENEPAFGPITNLSGRASDYVTQANVDLGSRFGAAVRARIQDDTFDIQRIDAALRGSVWRVSAQARYFSVTDTLAGGNPTREINGSASLRLTRNWDISYGLQRDLDSNINLRQDIRLTYRDDCSFLELGYNRNEFVDRTLGRDEGFQVRVGLSTLGVLGGS